MKKICFQLYPSNISSETRIKKISGTLIRKGVYDRVYILGIAENDLPTIERLGRNIYVIRAQFNKRINLPAFIMKLVKFFMYFLTIMHVLKRIGSQNIYVHCRTLSVSLISIILKIRFGAILIYDVHELESEVASSGRFKKYLLRYLENRVIHRFDGHIFVTDSIRDFYHNKYGVDGICIENYCEECAPSKACIQTVEELLSNIPSVGMINLLYSGMLVPNRGVEELLQAASTLEKQYNFIFVGEGPLENLVLESARNCNNVFLLKMQKQSVYQEVVRRMDVVVALANSPALSYQFSLPNKFIDGANAGKILLASDIPEQRKIVQRFENGLLVSKVTKEKLLLALTDINQQYERLSDKAASTHGLFEWSKLENRLARYLKSLDQTIC